MAADEVRVTSADQLRAALAAGTPAIVIEVTVAVEAWMLEAPAACAASGAAVAAHLDAPQDLDVDRRGGWEIGAATALLGAGIDDLRGIAVGRLARVREVSDQLASHAGEGAR